MMLNAVSGIGCEEEEGVWRETMKRSAGSHGVMGGTLTHGAEGNMMRK